MEPDTAAASPASRAEAPASEPGRARRPGVSSTGEEADAIVDAPSAIGRPSSAVPMAVLLLLALAAPFVLLRSPVEHAAGWDESMHAELPAARMLVALEEPATGSGAGFFDALLDCEQYPFVQPLVLAAGQSLGELGEESARFTSALWWGLGLAAIAWLARQAAGERRRAARVPAAFVALGLAAFSPMAQAFARTLFLELAFATWMAFALVAWIRRPGVREDASRTREIAAGALLTLAFFTKFNYGGLFALALALDWLVDALSAWRARRLGAWLARVPWLGAVPLAVATWWFVLPLPGGAEHAASHRAAFLGFLGGNLEMASASIARRLLHLGAYLAPSPAVLALAAIGLAASLAGWRGRAIRTLWLCLLALGTPVLFHPFHLERFWLPVGVPLWALAGAGFGGLVARRTPERLGARALFATGALAVLLAVASLGAVDQALWCARRLGELPDSSEATARAREVFEGWIGPLDERVVPTAGLRRGEADALLDRIAAEVGPSERFGWVGLSSELSPAVLHLGLYARGGSPLRLAREAHRPIDVQPAPGGALPDWSLDRLARFAEEFDLLFFTDPPDLKDRPDRRALREAFHRPLVEELGWEPRRIAVVPIDRGPAGVHEVGLYVCRKPR